MLLFAEILWMFWVIGRHTFVHFLNIWGSFQELYHLKKLSHY